MNFHQANSQTTLTYSGSNKNHQIRFHAINAFGSEQSAQKRNPTQYRNAGFRFVILVLYESTDDERFAVLYPNACMRGARRIMGCGFSPDVHSLMELTSGIASMRIFPSSVMCGITVSMIPTFIKS